MTPNKTKREVQDQIEAARKAYLKTGRRMRQLKSESSDHINMAKPRKQRLGLYA
jgi:hypothetical protein